MLSKTMTWVLCFIVILPILANESLDWSLENTEIYNSIYGNTVQFHPENGFFLLDRRGKRLLHYGIDGTFVGQIGREGQGPGEYNFVSGIQLLGDRLYLIEFGEVEVYDLEGNPIKTMKSPSRVSNIRVLQDGWVHLRQFGSQMKIVPLEVIVFDRSFENERVLAGFGTIVDRGGKPTDFASFRPGKPRKYNPAPSFSLLETDSRGRFLIVHPSHTRDIFIYDTKSGADPVHLSIPGDPLPFPTAYGERRLKRMQEISAEGGRDQKFVADFPDYFPIIGGVQVMWDDRIVVTKYPPGSDEEIDPNDRAAQERMEQRFIDASLVFDLAGNPQDYREEYSHNARIIGFAGDWVYVSVWNVEAEEATITRRPRTDYIDFLKKNPAYESD